MQRNVCDMFSFSATGAMEVLTAGVLAAAISSTASAQCPDCQDLSCNIPLICGCAPATGAGCSTKLETTVEQGLPGPPQVIVSGNIDCCGSTTQCGPMTLSYTQVSGYSFCINVSGGWDPGPLPGWTFSVGGQWCYNNSASTTATYQFSAAACSKKTATILKREIPLTIRTKVARTATYSVTDTCHGPPSSFIVTQDCGTQSSTSVASTPRYETVESEGSCPLGSPCRPRRPSRPGDGGLRPQLEPLPID
jgi:hypothetical protein